jgi:hypothetical protein
MRREVRLHAQFAGEAAVTPGVCVAQAVAVFVGDLPAGLAHGLDDLADEFFLIGSRRTSADGVRIASACP